MNFQLTVLLLRFANGDEGWHNQIAHFGLNLGHGMLHLLGAFFMCILLTIYFCLGISREQVAICLTQWWPGMPSFVIRESGQGQLKPPI